MRILKLLLAGVLSAAGISSAFAQTITTDILYDFSEGQPGDTLQSEIRFVYAGSSQIVVAGNVQHTGGNAHCFTAAFDYNGSLLWKKEIAAPQGFYKAEISGFSNLKKLDNGNFAVAGLLTDMPDNDTLHIPFLYIFGNNGDSVSLQLMNRPLWKLGALNRDDAGHIMMAGLYHNIQTDPFNVRADSLWVTQRGASGEELWTMEFMPAPGINGLMSNVFDIIWQPAYNWYIISIGGYYGGPVHRFVGISTDSSVFFTAGYIYGNPPIGFFSVGLSADNSLYADISLFKRREADDFNFVCSATLMGEENIKGLYYDSLQPSGSEEQWGLGYFISPYESDTILMDNGGMAIREAVNGDMLILKKASKAKSLNAFNYIPFLMRADNAGNIEWEQYYTHLNTTDTNIDQYLNDMSVAPDGRIVLAGALKSQAAVPGLYDTVGSVSWLVVMNDSAHDGNVGIPDLQQSLAQQVSVYPNPASDHINIQCGSLNVEQVYLSDYSGRIIRNFPSQNRMLDITGIAPGMYLLKVVTDKGSVPKKILIQ